MQLELGESQRGDDTEERKLLRAGQEVGVLRLYLATKEEVASIKQHLKRKIKQGQPFSAKVFLDVDQDQDTMRSILSLVEGNYPDLKGKVYLLKREGHKLTTLSLV